MFRREFAPEHLVWFARRAEALGFDELWVVEDLGYHGGFTQATAALAATERLGVGLGIAPAVARNAAYAAMEIATLSRLFPGRFHMGFGHGMEEWIAQVGATPISWLAALGEVSAAAKALVAGQRVTVSGRHVQLDDVALAHPATALPPVSLGVRGPKSIELAAQVADGVILAEGSGPGKVSEVRDQLGPRARITVLVWASADTSAATPEPAITGPSNTWVGQASAWFASGADSVVFTPLAGEPHTVIDNWSIT